MKELSANGIQLTVRQRRHVGLNVAAASAAGSNPMAPRKPGTTLDLMNRVSVMRDNPLLDEEPHPLLQLYPFEFPTQDEKPDTQMHSSPHAEAIPNAPQSHLSDDLRGFPEDLGDFSDEELAELESEASQTALLADLSLLASNPARRRRRSAPAPRRKRPPVLREFLERFGMVLAFILVCHALSSYQLARLMLQLLEIPAPLWALGPGLFLFLLLATLALSLPLKEQRHETVAIAMLAVGVVSAFMGFGCKVLLIFMGHM